MFLFPVCLTVTKMLQNFAFRITKHDLQIRKYKNDSLQKRFCILRLFPMFIGTPCIKRVNDT